MIHQLIKLFFIMIFVCSAHANETMISLKLQNLGQKIDSEIATSLHSNNYFQLNQIRHDLNKQQAIIKECLIQEQNALEDLDFQSYFLEIESNLPSLLIQKKNYQEKLALHQANLKYCAFYKKKTQHNILMLNLKTYEYNRHALFQPQSNIIQTFKKNLKIIFSLSLKNTHLETFLINNYLVFKRLGVVLIFVPIFLLIMYIQSLKSNYFSLNYSQIIFAYITLLFTNPVFLSILNNNFHDNFMLSEGLYTKFGSIEFIQICVCFFYFKYIRSISYSKDLLLAIIGAIIILGIIYCLDAITLIRSYDYYEQSLDYILTWKYIFLCLLLLLNLIINHFLKNNILKNLSQQNIFFNFYSLLFQEKRILLNIILSSIAVIGFIGFVDLAISLWFFLMLSTLSGIWFFMFKHVLNEIIDFFENPNHFYGKKVHSFLFIDKHQQFYELKILKFIMLFASGGLTFIMLWYVAHLPVFIFYKVYEFFFISQKAVEIDIVIYHLVWAFAIFLILNLVNRIISTYLAKQFCKHLENLEKYQNIFYLLGLVIITLICLQMLQINLSTLSFIIGALSFGLGIGLRDMVGNFISGLMLMFANPLAKGHYVIISDAHGFIKKISLLDTQIESFDKVILTVPNLKIFSSIVQNFSLSKKAPARFHFTFILPNINKLELYKQMILEILAKEEHIIMTGKHLPTFLVLPSNNLSNLNEIQLNLGFSLLDIRQLWRVVSNLTQNILLTFKRAKLPISITSNGLPTL